MESPLKMKILATILLAVGVQTTSIAQSSLAITHVAIIDVRSGRIESDMTVLLSFA